MDVGAGTTRVGVGLFANDFTPKVGGDADIPISILFRTILIILSAYSVLSLSLSRVSIKHLIHFL